MSVRFLQRAVLLLAIGMFALASACSSVNKEDETKIKARVDSFFNNMATANVKGYIGDIDPKVRSGCQEQKVGVALTALKALEWKVKETKVKSVKDNVADTELLTSQKGKADERLKLKLVKDSNEWYVDVEGKGCSFGI